MWGWVALGVTLSLLVVSLLVVLLPLAAKSTPIRGNNIGNVLLDVVAGKALGMVPCRFEQENPETREFLTRFQTELEREKVRMDSHNFKRRLQLKYVFTQWLRHYRGTLSMGYDLWAFSKYPRELAAFWDQCGPVVRAALLKAALPDAETYDVLLHFRCADSPFNRHANYHLQKADFYRWAFRNLRVKPGATVHVLGNSTWLTNPQEQDCCHTWGQELHRFLQEEGYRVQVVESGSVIQDFSRLLKAKKLVGSTSTYALMASFGRRPGTLAFPHLGAETSKGYDLADPCPAWMYPKPGLLNANVLDYFDKGQVTEQLFGH